MEKLGSETLCKPVGTYLVEAGLLSIAQVEMILRDQAYSDLRFGEIAALRGWVKQETVEFLINRVISPEREAWQKRAAVIPHSAQVATPQRASQSESKATIAGNQVNQPGNKTTVSNVKTMFYQKVQDDEIAWIG
uniref:Uncharacterized protein n=1 Tax=Cyanothece sp. (strain PCC 7425 / ATCC 29141) TaxID=395961 RepID=B8HLY2_CYAP4